jgi:hypothetical protein
MHARGVEAADVLATEDRGFEYQGNELEGALNYLLNEMEHNDETQQKNAPPGATQDGVRA